MSTNQTPTDSESRWKFMSRKVIGRQDNPMLIRWRLLQTPWFGIYLHFIHREDLDRLPHDHPWTFWTLILRGSYQEAFWPEIRHIGGSREQGFPQFREQWSFRRFDQRSGHRIISTQGKVTTLVVVGRKRTTWGFWNFDGRFTDWRDYEIVANGWSDQQRMEARRG